MGVSHFFLSALRELYKANFCDILFNGAVYDGFSICSGIKQGCPASGSIFVLCLDPFLRMLATLLPDIRHELRAFADDMAIVVLHLLRALPILHDTFHLLRRATRLRLNAKKTVIIPLWKGGAFDARRFLVDTLPGMGDAKVAYFGKYLGIYIGPDGDTRRWDSLCSKFSQRANMSQHLSSHFLHAVLHYRTYTFSTACYLIQFHSPPARLLKIEQISLQRLLRGPCNAIPTPAIHQLKELGIQHEAPSLRVVSDASQLRLARATPRFDFYCDLIDNGFPDDWSQLLQPRDVPWATTVSIHHIQQTVGRHRALFLRIGHFPPRERQGLAAGELRAALPPYWRDLIRRRVSRWVPAAAAADAADCVLYNLKHLAGTIPDSVLLTYVRSVTNAWTTSRRFQEEVLPCRFCHTELGDHIAHYLACPVMQVFAREHFPLAELTGSDDYLQSLLLLLRLPTGVAGQIVVLHDVLFSAHRHLRHGDVSTPASTMQARLRALRRRHPSLRAIGL